MQSRRPYRSRWHHCNTPEALRRRRAAADAKREAMAATAPPINELQPLTVWQRIEVVLYVPTSGRCDQHAVEIDGERVGLLSASQIGVKVREMVRKRPSVESMEESRRVMWEGIYADPA
ncbi:MAG TPA: hypothetical protein PL196_00010 [Burkholderiaceae bacterium]|nr:hypothetical protein [Burkholderiaceae bacterium]